MNERSVNRRKAISKLGAGLFAAAAAASRSFAGEGTSQEEASVKEPLQDPLENILDHLSKVSHSRGPV
jgi:hypothetical protein